MSEPPFKLMYRRPDRDEYQKLTDVMDEIIIKLNDLSERLESIETKDPNPEWTD
jgi:hypothetical protein